MVARRCFAYSVPHAAVATCGIERQIHWWSLSIADPIVTVLFQRGAFDAANAAETGAALAAFALGLPAYVLIKALAPGFFAREDTATPVKVAVLALVVNVASK